MDITPPAGFLAELGDIHDFIPGLLDCERKSGWHWPTFYLLYVKLDRVAMLLMQVGHLFGSPAPEPDGPFADDAAPDAPGLLGMIDTHQKTIVALVFQLYRNTRPSAAGQAIHDLAGAHVHPKSGWYQTLMAGPVSCDTGDGGRTFQRTALPAATGIRCERIDAVTAECMLRHQRFDTDSVTARQQLAEAAGAAGARLGAVQRTMSRYLLANCTMEDLLHPCSR